VQVKFVDTNPPSNRRSYMVTNAELEALPEDSQAWFKNNMINNHYKNR